MFTVVTLYQFIPLDHLPALQQQMQSICKDLTGTLLLAPEGMNGTLAGPAASVDAAIAQIRTMATFKNIAYQYSKANKKPFRRLKVRIKKEIVTIAQPKAAPLHRRGVYVEAMDWNAMLDQAAIVVDVRNHYECRLGTFQGAVHPQTDSFSQFPHFVEQNLLPYKDRAVAMFCTGGIRCEKASAYMLASGFQQVYQLHGGILQYLAQVPQSVSRWQGECFVFDERVALGHGLAQGQSLLCYGCRMPLAAQDVDHHYEPGRQCKYCFHNH